MEPSWGLWHRFPLGPHVVCRRSIAQEFARLTDEHSLVHTFSSVASCKACAIVKLHGFHGHFVVDDQLKAIALIPATRLAAGTLRRHGDGHLNTSCDSYKNIFKYVRCPKAWVLTESLKRMFANDGS